MATNRSYTVIGGFLLGALILIAVAVLAFGGTRLLSNSRQAIMFFDQSVLGLSTGSRVLFRGVQIGTVKNVQLRLDPHANSARIAVTIEVTGNDVAMLNGAPVPQRLTVKQLVHRGLRAQLVIYSYVTSQLAVNLSFHPGTKANYVVNPSKLNLPEIPAIPSEIEQIKGQIAKLPFKQTLKRVNRTMQSMVSLATDLDKTVNKVAPNLDRTSSAARQTLITVRKAVKSNNKQLQATIRSVHELTDNANQALGARDKQLAKLLGSAQQTTDKLGKLSENLENLTSPGSDTRQNMESAIRDLSASASNLRRFTETIERDPHALLFGGPNS